MPKPHTKTGLLGQNLRVLQPKLRMIANGDVVVNTMRAEHSAAVKVTSTKALADTPQVRGATVKALTKDAFRRTFRRKPIKPKHLKTLARNVLTNVFIHTTTPETLPPKVVKETGRQGRIAKAT